MKKILYLLLILFITNQFSASLVSLTENCGNVNIGIFDQDEEEENSKESKDTKELKSDFIENKNFDFAFSNNNKSPKINTFYLIAKYKVATTINILPPKRV